MGASRWDFDCDKHLNPRKSPNGEAYPKPGPKCGLVIAQSNCFHSASGGLTRVGSSGASGEQGGRRVWMVHVWRGILGTGSVDRRRIGLMKIICRSGSFRVFAFELNGVVGGDAELAVLLEGVQDKPLYMGFDEGQ